MKINVQKILEMWDRKNFTIEERKKDFKAIINYYDNIINHADLGLLTININSRKRSLISSLKNIHIKGDSMKEIRAPTIL